MDLTNMTRYVGTKVIHAEPMTRGEYNLFRGWTIPADEDPSDPGFIVKYSDDYVSWSPAFMFTEAYRPTDGMTFGQAIDAAIQGFKIARSGWNGKNQFVEHAVDIAYHTIRDGVVRHESYHDDIGSQCFVFSGTRGTQVGWLASQSDMLASDWYIVD